MASTGWSRSCAAGVDRVSRLHLVFGGRVKDPQGLDFDLDTIDIVGVFPDYASALDAWRSNAQRTVDDAEMKYVVVHLHRLLEPALKG
jgi:hypothetical protein